MAINEWWREDPAECYWLEITDRADLGADLHAPQLDDAGRDYWSYGLVTAVQPGDIVLHWHKSLLGSPAIVGYSTAMSGPSADEIVWDSQGTYGRTRKSAAPEASWKYALTGYTPLAKPVGQDAFRRVEPKLRGIKKALEAKHTGSLYFPFAFSDKRPVRAAQGYLVKFPAQILSVVIELEQIPDRLGDARIPTQRPSASEVASVAKRGKGSGYLSDERVRLAIERHSVNWVMSHYCGLGYKVKDVGNTESFDVLAVDGRREIHVEVKGSSGTAASVELTRKEVRHAGEAETHLVVVDKIAWLRKPDGSIATYGGRIRIWEAWTPAAELLEPSKYRYQLPSGSTSTLAWDS